MIALVIERLGSAPIILCETQPSVGFIERRTQLDAARHISNERYPGSSSPAKIHCSLDISIPADYPDPGHSGRRYCGADTVAPPFALELDSKYPLLHSFDIFTISFHQSSCETSDAERALDCLRRLIQASPKAIFPFAPVSNSLQFNNN
jgi:hypothetical protein